MSIKIDFDVAAIAAQFKEFASQIEKELEQGVGMVANQTHAKIKEWASEELHSAAHLMDAKNDEGKKILDVEEVEPGLWVISLDPKAIWIDEGIEPGKDMKPDLLKNGKSKAGGGRYNIIPFDHSKPPSQQNPLAKELGAAVRAKLKMEGVKLKQLDMDPKTGSPRLGKIRDINMESSRPTSKASTPALERLAIYQTMNEKTGKVDRQAVTFRTVTDGPASQGKWIHPGFQGKQYFKRAEEWAKNEWETVIMPAILEKYK